MTAAEMAHLESLRATCMAAVAACQASVRQIDAMMLDTEPDPAPDAAWDSFDSTPNEATDGNRKNSKRR